MNNTASKPLDTDISLDELLSATQEIVDTDLNP